VTLLAVRGLAKAYRSPGTAFALSVRDLALGPGEALAVTGPSGCGKSTLLLMLGLALPPDAADSFVFAPRGTQADIPELWRQRKRDALARLRAHAIGIVPQTGGLLPWLSIGENIALTQRIAGRRNPELVAHLAADLGIAEQLRKKPAELSVGQRQRAAIARALAHRPALVLADEPTAAVHPALADAILALLLRETRALGAALVLATHDPERARRFGLPILPCEAIPPGADGVAHSTFRRPVVAAAA